MKVTVHARKTSFGVQIENAFQKNGNVMEIMTVATAATSYLAFAIVTIMIILDCNTFKSFSN